MSDINPQLLESIMLLCFGSSWPFAVARTLRTKEVKGKSIVFLMLILIGYISGVAHKLLGGMDRVIWLYVVNGTMVFTEIVLYFRYSRTYNDLSNLKLWLSKDNPTRTRAFWRNKEATGR